MANPIPYETREIPVVPPTPETFTVPYDAYRRLVVPGLIFPNTIVDQLRSLVEGAGDTLDSRGYPFTTDPDKDLGVHIDFLPLDHPTVNMIALSITEGSADVELTNVADPFARVLRWRIPPGGVMINPSADVYDLPDDTDDLFNKRMVNPDILKPLVHIGSVTVGDIVLFSAGGPNPVAHHFRTTSSRRTADRYLGTHTWLR